MNEKLRTIRARIGEIRDEIACLQSGEILVPLSVATARLDEQLDRMRAASDDFLRRIAAGLAQTTQGQFEIVEERQTRDRAGIGQALVGFNHAAIRARLLDKLNEIYAGGDEALSAADIAKRIGKLKTELAQAERDDYALTEQLGIPQRPDQNPALLLGID